MINPSRPSPRFSYCKRQNLGVEAWEQGYVPIVHKHKWYFNWFIVAYTELYFQYYILQGKYGGKKVQYVAFLSCTASCN